MSSLGGSDALSTPDDGLFGGLESGGEVEDELPEEFGSVLEAVKGSFGISRRFEGAWMASRLGSKVIWRCTGQPFGGVRRAERSLRGSAGSDTNRESWGYSKKGLRAREDANSLHREEAAWVLNTAKGG